MKLVDTSAWVHQLRRNGDAGVTHRVENLLHMGQAAWCAPVRVELWAGVNNDRERKILRIYEETLPDYPVTPEVWRLACEIASRGRGKGLRFPAVDLIVAACARHHGLEIEAADDHFEMIARI